MKVFSKYLATGIVGLFIVGILVLAYFLYQLPSSLATALSIVEPNQIDKIDSATRLLNITAGIELGLGLLAIIVLLTNKSGSLEHNTLYTAGQATDVYGAIKSSDDETELAKSAREVAVENLVLETMHDQKLMLDKLVSYVCKQLDACQGAIFLTKSDDNIRLLELSASYAYYFAESKTVSYEFGEGLVGQVAKEGKLITIQSVPKGYLTILSGLGSETPSCLVIAPIKTEEGVLGVMEIASFKDFSRNDEELIREIADRIAQQLSAHSQVVNRNTVPSSRT